ncbi:hypothetical protein NQ318_015075 [Aromia moschata]|uniref:Bacterial surface antigen (D15) domain-containing protein n=1 Tax=Aromia moschata TaxID=1265417 RepID=A0AAV8YXR1_9CUCU|nr:hypothetical protein NQ318_015075 [Aromia moschata]
MGTVHAKAEENFTEAPAFGDKNIFREPTETFSFKEVDLEAVRARVDKINVDGLSRTKNDIVEDCIKELFKAKDFQDVLLKAHRVSQSQAGRAGVFQEHLRVHRHEQGPEGHVRRLGSDVQREGAQAGNGGVTTHVGNNEGALLVGMRAPNLFGRGERVQMEYSHGSKKTSNFNVAFIKPFRGRHRPTLTTSVFQTHSEWPTSGYKQVERGLLVDLGFYSAPLLKHNVQWEGNIRDLNVLSRTTSFNVREQCGLNLKSALKHILSVDLRDDLIFPQQRVALPADVGDRRPGRRRGVPEERLLPAGELFHSRGFHGVSVLQACLSGGHMSSLSNDMKISMSDMYYLGGPLSVRGFQMRGVGPHSDSDALGSMSYWAAGLHLFTPLPFRPGRGGFGELFRTHFFVNAGNIGNFQSVKGEDLVEALRANLRLSYGLGIALRLGNMARLEVNYCFPHAFDKGDQVHRASSSASGCSSCNVRHTPLGVLPLRVRVNRIVEHLKCTFEEISRIPTIVYEICCLIK